MKHILILFLICLCLACNKKAKQSITITPHQLPKTEIEPQIENVETKDLEEINLSIEEVLHYGKTSCFGNCPVFYIKFFSDGTVQYNGIKNVKLKGIINTSISKARIANLLTAITAKGYFNLADQYPLNNRRIRDLPNTILQINNLQQDHTVVNNHDAPPVFFEMGALVEAEMKRLGLL